MTKDKEEVSEKDNASEEIETGSEQENPEEKVQSDEKEIAGDYLEEEPEKTEAVDYKKRYGDSTREYQKLKEDFETKSQALENLEKLVSLNPRILEEIEAAQKSDNQFLKKQVDEALEPVRKVAEDLQNRDRIEKVKVLADFEKSHPKLFSPKATAKEKKAIRQKIGKVANALVETGMSFKDAVSRAYFTINPKSAEEIGRNKAYLEGLSEERAGFGNQVSAEGKKSGKVKYSKAELATAKKLGKKYYEAMLKET